MSTKFTWLLGVFLLAISQQGVTQEKVVRSADCFRSAESDYFGAAPRGFDSAGAYSKAQTALETAFRLPTGYLNHGDYERRACKYVKRASVKHLWEVDAPVQGLTTKQMVTYLTSRNHPKNGNVYRWYLNNFPELRRR